MEENENPTKQCPKCGNTIFSDICPYCHTNISQTKINKISTAEQTDNAKQIEKSASKIVSFIVGIIVLILVIVLISQCESNDNSCERCNKQGVYEIGGDRYCEKHYMDVMGEVIAWDGN